MVILGDNCRNMRYLSSNSVVLVALIFSFFIVSCTGEDGEPGPQGEQGEQGEQGDPGTADIYYSDWFDEEFIDTPTTSHSFGITDENINEDLGENSIILVYARTSNPAVFQLPVTVDNKAYYYIAFYENQFLRFDAETTDGSSQIFNNFPEFRFVIIKGDPSTGGRKADYRSMSYEQIATLFNIPD